MKFRILTIVFSLLLAGCFSGQPRVIVITATFLPPTDTEFSGIIFPTPTPFTTPGLPSVVPRQTTLTPNPTRITGNLTIAQEHIVRAGDTLTSIATTYNVSVDSILAINNLINPDILSVGQSIQLPDLPTEFTPDVKLLPNSRLVRSPSSSLFDLESFIQGVPGYIRVASDEVGINQSNGIPLTQVYTATEIIEQISLNYSIDPRILLAILEYRAGWLSNPNPSENLQTYPIFDTSEQTIDRPNLYRQLVVTANELNRGYYNWKYRGITTIELADQTRLLFSPTLNAGTVALQHFFSLNSTQGQWLQDVSLNGLYRIYVAYFGDPFTDEFDTNIPDTLVQPPLTLPFIEGEIWLYTGGHHGGWGSGSAWAAIDLAPPDERTPSDALCYVSEYWITAMAPGVIARSSDGVVVLDLDMDGNESTGWTILYLHLDSDGRVQVGQQVATGDKIGRPSCEGGFSTATHVHFGRRYNGEWIPADCEVCSEQSIPDFEMGNWRVIGLSKQEYQGFMTNGTIQLQAEQGRQTTVNRLTW